MNRDEQALFNIITGQTGLEINQQRQKALKTLLVELLNSTSLDELIETLQIANFIHPAWQRIIQVMTVGETYFFRNQYHFSALRNHILPELIEKRRNSGLKQLRVWCAGCATGEEPYSVAILLHELLPDIGDWSIALLATDVNEAYLSYAKQGVYTKRSFRNETPDALLEQWFDSTSRGYQVKGEIRRRVVFSPLNLVSDNYPAYTSNTMQMDLIMCRNVTIYFDVQTTKTVAERFHRALSTDGWLLVGHSEPNTEIYQQFKVRNFENAILYQKTSARQTAEIPITLPTRPEIKTPASPKKPAPIQKPVSRQQASPVSQAETKRNSLDLARQAANDEKWAEALKFLVEAERYDNLNPHIHYLRGLVHQQQGDIQEARASLQRAVYCDPQFALGHYVLGDLYASTGDSKKSVRHWRSALQALSQYDLDYEIPFSDGLTVEMLNGLIAYRLG